MTETHSSAGSYAVGALRPVDERAFEEHLAVCPGCRAEVLGFEEVTAELALLAAAPAPPRELRSRVLSATASVRQLPRDEKPDAVERSVRTLAEHRTARLDRTTGRRSRLLTLLVAAVSVLTLALGGTVAALVQRETPSAVPAADASLLSAPDARILASALPDGTRVSFVVSRQQDRALFVADGLPDPGLGRTYQLWTMRDGVPTPDATLSGGARTLQWFHGTVATAQGFAVTVEPPGGSKAPTSPILVSAAL